MHFLVQQHDTEHSCHNKTKELLAAGPAERPVSWFRLFLQPMPHIQHPYKPNILLQYLRFPLHVFLSIMSCEATGLHAAARLLQEVLMLLLYLHTRL